MMKRYSWIALLVCLVLPSMVNAQSVPREIPYQGRVLVQGTNWTGNATMKFALVNPAGDTTHWSNDGSSVGGGEPTAGLSVLVENGLYSLLLGDTNLVNMIGIPDNVFGFELQLRVWFNDGVNGSQLLSPDQPLGTVAYSVMAATLEGGISDADNTTNEVNTSMILNGAQLQITDGGGTLVADLADLVTDKATLNMSTLGAATNSLQLQIMAEETNRISGDVVLSNDLVTLGLDLTAASNALQSQISTPSESVGVSVVPLFQGGGTFTINTVGTNVVDLLNCESALVPTVYDPLGNIEVKLVVRVVASTAGVVDFQLRAHNGTSETFPIVPGDMSSQAVQVGSVFQSAWKDFAAGTSLYQLNLMGVVDANSTSFNNAYLLIRADQP